MAIATVVPVLLILAVNPSFARPPERVDLSQSTSPTTPHPTSATNSNSVEALIYYEDFEGPHHGWTPISVPSPPPVYWNRVGSSTILQTDFEAPTFQLGPLPQAGFGAWQSSVGNRVSISDENAFTGSQAVKVDRYAPQGDAEFIGAYRGIDFDASDRTVTLSIAVYLSASSSPSYWNVLQAGLRTEDPIEEEWVGINVEPSGQIVVVLPGPVHHYTGQYINRGRWARFDLEIAFATRIARVSLNGTGIQSVTLPGSSTYVLWSGFSGQFSNTDDYAYFDDLKLTDPAAWWCGTDDNCVLLTPPGYGNNWDQWLEKQVGPIPTGTTLELTHQYDTEQWYDFCRVKVSTDNGLSYTTLASFDGRSSGYVQTSIDMGAYAGQTVLLAFQFKSDGSWSDEDKLYDSNGAWRIAKVAIGSEVYDFGVSDHGWTAYALPPPPAWTTFRLEDNPYCDANSWDCSENYGRSWVAYDPNTNTVPIYTGPEVVQTGIESPAIPIPGDYERLILNFTYYRNLPLEDYMFFKWQIVSSGANGCPSTLSNNTVYYGLSGWQCARPSTPTDLRFDVTDAILPGSSSIQVRLSLIDMRHIWGQDDWSGKHTEGVYFDNVHLTAVNTTSAGIPPIDPCTPPPPEFVTVSGQVSSDCQGVLDGVTVDLNLPDAGMLTTTTDGGGSFSFADVPYSADEGVVAIVPPLGFAPVTPPDGQAQVTLDTDRVIPFSLSCLDPTGTARTIGYWKHQANVHLNDRGRAQESLEDMTATYPNAIFSHFHENGLNGIEVDGVTYMEVNNTHVPLSLEVIHTTLTVNRNGSMYDRARQQYLGVLLNVASGKLPTHGIISEDGATVSQALQQVAAMINDGDPSNDEIAKTISDEINNARLLTAGIVDTEIEHIAYRRGMGASEFRVGPSPFWGRTSVQFRLGEAGPVRAEVFDARGRLVRTLHDSWVAAGPVSIHWNGRDDSGRALAAGVYYVRLNADGATYRKSVVLLR